jgi:hypothetical protein
MINSLTNYNNMELVIKENECCVMELTRNMTKRLGQPRLNRCLHVSVSNNDVFSLDFNLYVKFMEVSRIFTAPF